MKTGSALTKPHAGVDGALGVELVRLLGADREVGDDDVDLGVLEGGHDVDRLGGGLVDRHAVVLAETVEGRATQHVDTDGGDVADLDRVVLRGVDRLREVLADLLVVDVERGDELHVGDVVVTELDVHEARHGRGRVGVLVVLHALDEGGGAVAHPHDCYSYGPHGDSPCLTGLLVMAGVHRSVLVRGWCAARGLAPLGGDQVGEPAHFALDRLDPVPLKLCGIPVDLGLRALEVGLDPGQSFLEPGTATLEHPEPDLHVGAPEEREPDVEVVVLPRGGTDLRHQALELVVPGVGDLVDDAGPARDRGGGRRLLDEVGPEHLLQRGVEGAVGQHPTPSEHQVEPLAQLVAVHGSLVQQSEDCQLDGLCATCHTTYRSDISATANRVSRRASRPVPFGP